MYVILYNLSGQAYDMVIYAEPIHCESINVCYALLGTSSIHVISADDATLQHRTIDGLRL